MAGRPFAEGWPVYERWIGWVWAGQVSRVIEELLARQQELGEPTKEDKEGSPRRVLAEALGYLSNHQDKRHYDEYRKAGLPLMSSHVESTVKQINYRVKGTEKLWTEEPAEALLHLRAQPLAYLINHQDRRHYDEYRKAGLPLMSSHVESTVKQINYRVKGTEKFWTEEGAEALLLLRAAH